MMDEIPVEVRDYLTAGDGLAQAAVKEQYPDLDTVLNAPQTRAAILRFLASPEPLQNQATGFTINAVAFLQSGASAKEAPVIRPLLQHPNPTVRLRTYEYLMAVYYPQHDRASILDICRSMLNDSDESVRVQAARWIQSLRMSREMEDFLRGWLKTAAGRGLNKTESFEIVQAMLKH